MTTNQAPAWCSTPRLRQYWTHPWRLRARYSRRFRALCWAHGYVSPNFTRAEWACHDGTAVPESLRANAQRHAFNLERLRHGLNDEPIGLLSAYRDPAYNRRIGGATQSRHMSADATDHSKAWVDEMRRRFGDRFRQLVERIFANGGVGTYPWGAVHFDSRGWRARWSSW